VTPFPPFRPRREHRPLGPRPRGAHVRVRWLGTAGHVVETATTTILIDPFLTRPSLLRTALRPLRSAPEAWWSWLPPRVDAILLGHSHYDHLLDAPAIARRTGARIVGSRSTASFARASGVPEAQIVELPAGGGMLGVGDCELRFVPSLHGRVLAGRVPFPGEVTAPPRLPARLTAYRMGGAFGICVRTPGPAIYHNGSADLVDAALDGVAADVLLVGLAGRQATPRYLARLTALLRPRLIVPTHHDAFFAPLEAGVRLLPGIDLAGFAAEAAREAPTARILTPTYDDVLALPADGADVRDAALYPR
jgi:L-ascorbate metabolism protein UlaG (beta-lactamase superfamily)